MPPSPLPVADAFPWRGLDELLRDARTRELEVRPDGSLVGWPDGANRPFRDPADQRAFVRALLAVHAAAAAPGPAAGEITLQFVDALVSVRPAAPAERITIRFPARLAAGGTTSPNERLDAALAGNRAAFGSLESAVWGHTIVVARRRVDPAPFLEALATLPNAPIITVGHRALGARSERVLLEPRSGLSAAELAELAATSARDPWLVWCASDPGFGIAPLLRTPAPLLAVREDAGAVAAVERLAAQCRSHQALDGAQAEEAIRSLDAIVVLDLAPDGHPAAAAGMPAVSEIASLFRYADEDLPSLTIRHRLVRRGGAFALTGARRHDFDTRRRSNAYRAAPLFYPAS